MRSLTTRLAGLNRSKKVIAFLLLAFLGSQNVQATTITLDFDAAPLGPIPGAFGSIVVGDFTITEAVSNLEVVVDGTEQVLRTVSGTLADFDISHSGGDLVFVGGRGRSIDDADVVVAKNGVDTDEAWRIPLGAMPGAFVLLTGANGQSQTPSVLIFDLSKTDLPGQPATGLINELTFDVDIIPEPSTFALATLGILGLACYGWRRKRQLAA